MVFPSWFFNRAHQAIWLVILTQLFASIVNALSAKVGQELPSIQIFFLSMVVCLCLGAFRNRNHLFGTHPRDVQALFILRAVFEVLAFSCFYYALSVVPLANAIAILLCNPLFASILAVILLGEKITLNIFIALLLGIIGVFVIQRPDLGEIDYNLFYVILAAFFFACCGVTIKKATTKTSVRNIVWYMILYTTPLAGLVSIPFWQTPSLEALIFCGIIGVLFFMMQYTISKALSMAPLIHILPFQFTQLLFASLWAVWFLGQMVEASAIIGGLIIFAGACIAYLPGRKPEHA